VRHHHAKGFLNPQVKCVPHTLGDVPAQGVKTARHGTFGLHLAFLDALARLKGGGLQLFQLLLGGVVGCPDGLRLGRRCPESRLQA
jgi:hypothetical protein